MQHLGFAVSFVAKSVFVAEHRCCRGAPLLLWSTVVVVEYRLDPTHYLEFWKQETIVFRLDENLDGGNHCSLPDGRLVKKRCSVKEKKNSEVQSGGAGVDEPRGKHESRETRVAGPGGDRVFRSCVVSPARSTSHAENLSFFHSPQV